MYIWGNGMGMGISGGTGMEDWDDIWGVLR